MLAGSVKRMFRLKVKTIYFVSVLDVVLGGGCGPCLESGLDSGLASGLDSGLPSGLDSGFALEPEDVLDFL